MDDCAVNRMRSSRRASKNGSFITTSPATSLCASLATAKSNSASVVASTTCNRRPLVSAAPSAPLNPQRRLDAFRVAQEAHGSTCGDELLQQLKSFSCEIPAHQVDAGQICARPVEARNQ